MQFQDGHKKDVSSKTIGIHAWNVLITLNSTIDAIGESTWPFDEHEIFHVHNLMIFIQTPRITRKVGTTLIWIL